MKFFYMTHPKAILAYLLWPLSVVYKLIIFIRKVIIKPVYLGIPVIIVGNITVGGTGKTPLVIWLAHFLTSQGYHPAIISRGYKSTLQKYPADVYSDSDPHEMGDEPVLLARRANCPVIIDPNRIRAIKYIIENHNKKNNKNINIIISDDGLQHYKLGRDIEIAVIDSERGLGNGFCLPAGPLREPASRLDSVDVIIENGIDMTLVPGNFYNVASPELTQEVEYFMGSPVHAVAGIGHPERFFESLKKLGLTIYGHEFNDHYNFKPNDLLFENNNDNNNLTIIMTEKDAVKCEKWASYNVWCLPVIAELAPEWGQKIVALLHHRH